MLRRTATDYLPTSINAYLALQPGYATTHVLPGGRTALQLLEDQLKLLERKVDEIGMALRQLDSQRLLAHGRFLEETFDRRSEDLGLPTNQPATQSVPVLEEHNEILRRAIHDGGSVDLRTQGEAFFAVFGSAVDATTIAASAQRLLDQHPWPPPSPPRTR